jgi:hypothetical protein
MSPGKASSRAVSELGYRVLVVGDACSLATPEAHAALIGSLGLLAQVVITIIIIIAAAAAELIAALDSWTAGTPCMAVVAKGRIWAVRDGCGRSSMVSTLAAPPRGCPRCPRRSSPRSGHPATSADSASSPEPAPAFRINQVG